MTRILRPCLAHPAGLCFVAALALLLVAGTAAFVTAAPPSAQAFQEHVAAGEFGQALSLARALERPQDRDAWLSQLAIAQAKAGSHDAAYKTIYSISDDIARANVLRATRETTPPAGAPGGAQADFNPLINMIMATVNRKDSPWDDVGGVAAIQPFRNGVHVDAGGVLRRVQNANNTQGLALARLDAVAKRSSNTETRKPSPLRKVSLPRLEKHVQLTLASGRSLTDDMLHLAGLEKIKYVMVYPETGDIVIAGPASGWTTDAEGRDVSTASGRPVLQLDDLVVLMRYLSAVPGGTFGCSIDPTAEGLARTQEFAQKSSANPIQPEQRNAWLKQLREQMGRQSISVDGIDPRTRVARVLVEADYRMKLVGMGLEEGTVNVPSYLDLVKVAKGQAPPALDVLRWWFTLKYDAVKATEGHDAFELVGNGVQVQSENEFLTARGQQIHTGKADPTNAEFAARFTSDFPALAHKYPVYADLQNIFDLALVSSLLTSERLAEKASWHMTCFSDFDQYKVSLGSAPTSVDSVINHRVVNGRHILVGVSGGVLAQPVAYAKALSTDRYGKLDAERAGATAKDADAWWWD